VLANCGHTAIILTAAPATFANNLLVARLGDNVGASPYEGIIITASPDVNAS
jgi:hypothetical protein